MQQGGGEDGPKDAGEAAGALGDADGRALFVGGGEVGEQAEQGRTREAGADG